MLGFWSNDDFMSREAMGYSDQEYLAQTILAIAGMEIQSLHIGTWTLRHSVAHSYSKPWAAAYVLHVKEEAEQLQKSDCPSAT